jgi:hypothetical protein
MPKNNPIPIAIEIATSAKIARMMRRSCKTSINFNL